MALIAGVILMMFGARKIPEFMKGLGSGIKEFKKATREVNDELQQAMQEEPPPPRKLSPPANTQAASSTDPHWTEKYRGNEQAAESKASSTSTPKH